MIFTYLGSLVDNKSNRSRCNSYTLNTLIKKDLELICNIKSNKDQDFRFKRKNSFAIWNRNVNN